MPSESVHIAAKGKSFYLSVRSDTTQNLEENIDRTFFDINCRNILFDPPPGVMEIKTKINK